jgi:RNA polymerase sigma-70 factor (ECF subfamily)
VGEPTNTGEPATSVDAEFGAGHAPPESRVDAAEHSPDGELIRRMQADDLDAFERFFARHRNVIYRTAYGLTGDRQAAEEVLQDTFARAWQRRTTLLLDISPVPWLHRVALNLCYSRLGRRRLRSTPIEDSMAGMLPDAAAEPDVRAERQELRSIVRDGVAGLAPKHQSVVVLYYLHGMSLQETAELLDVRLGTVKSRLHYALRSLRTRLEADRRFGGAYRPEEELVLLEREIGA